MKTISKFLLFTLVLLLVGLGTVTAVNDMSDMTSNVKNVPNDSITSDVIKDTSNNVIKDTTTKSSEETISHNKTIEKNNELKSNTKTARTTTVTSSTYNQYFNTKSTTSLIASGDTINLKGTFNNVDFTLDKSITLTSSDKSAKLYNCTVIVPKTGSGSKITYLTINNSAEETSGIILNDSSNLIIENNIVEVSGLNSYGLAANVNKSTIRFNSFETHKLDANTERTHTAVVLSCSYYNTFANNTVKSDGANCIYLSAYQAVGIKGGPSYYNNITGNKVQGANTGWSYTIQIFGTNNRIIENTVSGGYRGISTESADNTINNNDVNAYNVGIYAADNCNVQNNNIHVTDLATGITVGGENVKIIGNTIQTADGRAIEIQANNAAITDNTITSTENVGIHSKGAYSGVNIIHNTITTKREGILFEKQSNTKKVNNILVDRNTITSEAEYAINFLDAGAKTSADVNVTVSSSNVLTSSKGKGLTYAYLKPSNAGQGTNTDTNQVITITPENYSTYFTDETSNSNIKQNATIYLSGTFNNIKFSFNKKVHINGKSATINNGLITLTGEAHESTITDVTINNNNKLGTVHAIELFEVNNCKITNSKITNYATQESLGIFLFGANGNTITSNTITTTGDYLNNAILAYASDSNTINNNLITITQSNIPRGYDNYVMFNEKIGSIQEVLHNHGIILLYSSNNLIDKNTVTGTSQFKSYTAPSKDCQNSIVGIDIYFESNKNKVTGNTININSYSPFVYGMGVLGASWGKSITSSNSTDNIFENNDVTLKGGYFATGFIAGRNSANTQIKSNTFKIDVTKDSTSRGDYVYGITLENSTKSTINSNTITSTGSALYNIELFDSGNNIITNNKITGTGTHPCAIAGYRTSNNNIQNNILTLRKVNYGATSSAKHSDAIPYTDEGITLTSTSTNNIITKNTINTNATSTIKLGSETSNNKIIENSLLAKGTAGDKTVINQASNTVSNNFLHFVNATVNPLSAKIGDTITITANIKSTTTDTKNLTAKFQLGTNNIGTSKISNGKATLKYQISNLYRPTTYQIKVTVSGNNFQNATATEKATFTKEPEKVTVKVAKVLKTIGSKAQLTANITTSNGGKISAGQAIFYLDNKKLRTVNVTLGKASYTYPISSNSKSGVHTIKVQYLGTNDYKTAQATNILGIQTKTSITLASHKAKIGQAVNIKATIKTGSSKVSAGKALIYIGNKKIATATIKNGVINYKYTVPITYNKTTYNLKIVYNGNNTQSQATKTSKIKMNGITPVFNYSATSVTVGKTASLVLKVSNGKTGKSLYNAQNGSVTVKLNGKTLKDKNGKAITGNVKNGKLTIKFTAPEQLSGKQNITFTYKGNNKFATLTKTYKNGLNIKKITTKLTISKIKATKYGNKVIVTGKATDSTGKVLKNVNVKVKINKKTVTVKTNAKGVYKYTATTNTVGTNTVLVTYAGNNKYASKTVKTTFNVSKQNVKILINKIANAKINKTATIKGTLKDANGKVLKNTNIKIKINTKTVTVKTNSKGAYAYKYKVTGAGKHKVSVIFAGNKLYNAKTLKTSFKTA